MAKTEVEMLNGRTIADTKARKAISELPTVELVAILEDGTAATYMVYGWAVAE